MQLTPSTRSSDPRVRCVFSDAVMSFSLGDHPTLADIADMLSEPALSRHGAPLSIDLAWPVMRTQPAAAGQQLSR